MTFMLHLCFLLTLCPLAVYCQDEEYIKEIAARIAALETADQSQKLEIMELKETVRLLKEENEKRNVRFAQQDQQITALEGMVEAQQRIIKDLALQVQYLKKFSDVSKMIENPDKPAGGKLWMPGKNSSGTVDLNRTGGKRNIRDSRFVTQTPETVAFHATVDTVGHVTKLTVGQTIVFDTVHLNLGGGYHSSAGLFLAPAPGVYIFSLSVMLNTDRSAYIALDLVQNGAVIAETYANGYDQGSVSAVAQLKSGDEVLVKVHGPNDSMFYGEKLTSFMGILVLPM